MFLYTSHQTLLNILCNSQPQALAWISGNAEYPRLNGMVKIYTAPHDGVLIETEIFHLPESSNGNDTAFFGFHIHETGDCSNNFQNTGGHYNPTAQNHPYHAGDLPPLMATSGYAWTICYDGRLTVPELLGKSVIIHRMPDDFTTQPAGNAGEKIACGIIRQSEF